MSQRPSTAPAPNPKYLTPQKPRPKSSAKKQRLTPKDMSRMRQKYNKQAQGADQYLYGVKLDPSVSASVYSANTLPSQASSLKNIPNHTGAFQFKTDAPPNPMSRNVGPISPLPRPSSPEVITMMKTLLSRGGIDAPPAPTMPNPAAYKTVSIVPLYDDQALLIEKLRIKGGDKAAKNRFAKFIAYKDRVNSKSLDFNTWEDHLPSYARHAVSKNAINPLTPADSLVEAAPLLSHLEKKQNAIKLVLTHFTTHGSRGVALQGSPCMDPAVHKIRCALCLMFFDKSSMKGCISMKSVMELQSHWGVEHTSKKYSAASFLYKKVALCQFCEQLFSTKSRRQRKFAKALQTDDKTSGTQDAIKNDIELLSLIHAREVSEIQDRNLAVGGVSSQSSTVDGKIPTMAITGRLGGAPPELCTRTRREFESWWEVTLDTHYPIKSIVVYTRVNGTDGKQGSYRLPPFWVFLTKEPMGTSRLSEVKRKAVAAACVYSDDEKVVWKLPPNAVGRNVRVQVEGVKSLQLAQVEILKGGLILDSNTDQTKNLASTTADTSAFQSTTFAFDFIGRPKATSSISVAAPSASRPTTAPNRNNISSPINTKRPSTSHQQKKPLAPPVESLFQTTGAAYAQAQFSDSSLLVILNGFNAMEIDALKRNYLHFAEVGVGVVPRHTEDSVDYDRLIDELLEAHRLSISQCAKAVTALKSAGSSGPKSRFKEVFGFWEKDEDHNQSLTDDDSHHFVAAAMSSKSYVELIESYCVDELGPALHDTDYARQLKHLPPMSITWFEFVHVIKVCMGRNLNRLGVVFNVSTEGEGNGFQHSGRLSPGESLEEEAGRGKRKEKAMPPVLSLSQSIKFYDNASATYADSPAPLRKPKLVNTRKSKIQKSEENYNELIRKVENSVEPNLTGMEYVEEQDRRRDRMNEIHAKVKKPDTSPALNRRNCSLCLLSFPMDAIIGSVTVKNLKSLSKKWKVQFQKFGEGVSESALLMQHRIPVCSFCEQFFDPDSLSGLSSYKRKKRLNYESFFDDAYPKLFNDVYLPDLQSEFVIRARKKSHYMLLDKMEEHDGLYRDQKSYKAEEAIRVSEQSSLITTNSRESHGRAINDWSDTIEKKAEGLEAYNPSKLTLRSQTNSSQIAAEAEKQDHLREIRDDPLKALIVTAPAQQEDEDEDEESSLQNPLDSGMTQEEMEREDLAYLSAHSDKMSKKDNKGHEKLGKHLRGTMRIDKGRKVASTGISIYEFSSQQEKQRANDFVGMASGRSSSVLVVEEDEDDSEGGDTFGTAEAGDVTGKDIQARNMTRVSHISKK